MAKMPQITLTLAVDDTIRVTITVMNENEAPVFPATIAPIEVAEDTVPGTNIGNPVVATDVDSDDKLTYTLGTTDAAFFDIDPEDRPVANQGSTEL